MSKDSSNVPNLNHNYLSASRKASPPQSSYVSPWSLEDDYPSNTPFSSTTKIGTSKDVTTFGAKDNHGELTKWESYGGNIYGPSYSEAKPIEP
jgi:hypothetical protein